MITINGQTFKGNNVTVINGKVIIDGKDETPESKSISVIVTGNIETLNIDHCDKCTIQGDVGFIKMDQAT